MISPVWRKIISFDLLIKSRHVIKYMSVFLLLIFLLVAISSSKPAFNTNKEFSFPDVKDTIYVYDTVYQYDTTYMTDTIYKLNSKIDPLHIYSKKPRFIYLTSDSSYKILKSNMRLVSNKHYLFSIDLFASPSYSLHALQSDVVHKEALNLNKLSLSPNIGSAFGIGINFHSKSSIFTSGLTYFTIRENYDFLASNYTFAQKEIYDYYMTSVIGIDTIKFINIDTLLATGDTIYDYYYDTTQTYELDSNKITITDTTENKFIDKSKNKYIYIEIPLKYSFTMYRPGFSISPEIGIIPSFFVNSKGKIVSLANLNQSNTIKDETRFAAINLSIYTGLKVKFYLTEHIDFFTAAFYKHSINSIFRDYPIIYKFNTFGFSFGLRYKILIKNNSLF